jgi:hypothetical protein
VTRSFPAPNGEATIGELPLEIGDVAHTAETPALDIPPAPTQPHVTLDWTLAHDPGGASCIRIIGSPVLAAHQAVRLGQELIALGTYVGEQRSLLGNTE